MRSLARALELSDDETAQLQGVVRQVPAPSIESHAPAAIRVLGDLVLTHDGLSVKIPDQVRPLLMRLALSPGAPVPRDELCELVWPELNPDTAGRRLTAAVRRLRALIAPIGVVNTGSGVRLDAMADELDLVRFRQLAGTTDLDTLIEAVRLWRGRPDGLEPAPWLAESIEDAYVATLLRLADQSVAEGRALEVLPVLREAARTRALDEPLWAAYIKALAAVGRQAEALQAYATVRKALTEELGLDPSPVLDAVHQGTLEGRWHTRRPRLVDGAQRRNVPREVPTAPTLVGRQAEVSRLETALAAGGTALVTGSAGSGKSALALTVAARLADAFPDGQMYADLHSPTGDGVAPTTVLRRFLRTLGVPDQLIPDDESDAATLLRSELAGRRVLIVLDSVSSVGHVIPLLPAPGGCATIVTSRHRLPDLASTIDLQEQIHLGELERTASVDLIGSIIGEERVATAPQATETLATACGDLPLALRIAAARLLSRPEWSIEEYARRLTESSHRLAELALGEVSVAASLEISYIAMSVEARRTFRLCALIPAYDFDPAPASTVLDRDPVTTQRLLEALVDANMLQTLTADDGTRRYRYHDLLRLHATHLAEEDQERQAAWGRLADWLLHSTIRAVDSAYPGRLRAARLDPLPGEAWSADDGRDWLDREGPLLLHFADRAAIDPEWCHYAWKLADQSRIHFRTRLDVATYLHFVRTGAEAAERDEEPRAEAFLRTLSADALGVLGRMDEAWAEAGHARSLLEGCDWVEGTAFARTADGLRHRISGSADAAEVEFAAALHLLGEDDGTAGLRAWTQHCLGMVCYEQGRFAEARQHLVTAVELGRSQGGPTSLELTCLAATERCLGRLAEATTHLEEAYAQAHHNRSPYATANALEERSLSALAGGAYAEALDLADRAHLTARAYGDVGLVAATACTYAAALHATGNLHDSIETFEYAVDLSHQHSAHFTETRARLGLAQALDAIGAAEQARLQARRGWELADRHGFAHLRKTVEQTDISIISINPK